MLRIIMGPVSVRDQGAKDISSDLFAYNQNVCRLINQIYL